MKKTICMILSILFALSLTACSNSTGKQPTGDPNGNDAAAADAAQSAQNTPAANSDIGNIDIDLTALSSTMVYSEVYNMMTTPDDYIGKNVKMTGSFSRYEDPSTEAVYYACLIADATACCSQGLEFTLAGNYIYPQDYPELGEEITVMGEFETYEENGTRYCRLANAAMI